MKLGGIELQCLAKRSDVSRRGVNEDTHSFHFLRKLRANFCSLRFADPAGAFRVEIETEEIGAGVDGGESVGGVGDAADFDADHGYLRRSRRRNKERRKRRGGIGSEHEVRANQKSVKTSAAKLREI